MKAAALLLSREALVFDLDGTLADTLTDLWLALNSALREAGLAEVGIDLVRGSLHGGLPATARAALTAAQVGFDALPELTRRYDVHYRRRAHASSSLYPGVVDLLDACRQRRIRLAVCTNKEQGEALALLTRLAIFDRFQCVVGGDPARDPKPHPAPLLHALRELGVEPNGALLIGDSHIDAQCAAHAGVDFVLYAGGYGAAQASQYPFVAMIEDYQEWPWDRTAPSAGRR